MFNMQLVGRKIIEYRKNMNMTQTELADQLNVSFQAVSNWERGNSMPDISKLPELASIFNVSVDELLGQKSKLVHSALQNQVADFIQTQGVTQEEFEAHLPILKPKQIDEIIDNADLNQFEDLSSLLPFLSEETVNQLAQKRASKGDSIDIFLPFIGDDAIEALAQHRIQRGEDISTLLPFMSDEAVEKRAQEKLDKGQSIDSFLPFLNDDFIENLALSKLKRGESIQSFLPFLNDKFLNRIVLSLDK